jgi:hypothetical protein
MGKVPLPKDLLKNESRDKKFSTGGKMMQYRFCFLSVVICLLFFSVGSAETLIDYFLPMPIVRQPLRSDKWGCGIVGKRDIYNGMEDTTCKKYCYWDGPIIKGPDGKYHMFASRWDESGGHWSWLSSVGIHAVSDSIMGPYVDMGKTWPNNQNGKGHNMTILQLKDGTYASVVSDTRPGDFFTASSLDGPWTFAGSIKINANGFSVPQIANLSIIIRPDDGKYMVVARNGQIMISSGGLTGPYMIQGNSVYNEVNLPNLEDPVLWYSGGLYHIVVNSWSERKAYHLTSMDGIKNWKNKGLAFDPKSDFLRYTDGTVNHWNKIERPGVTIENGHVTHFTFSVIDVEKENDHGNDGHGSKVIVVPFDGMRFDGVTAAKHETAIGAGLRSTGDAVSISCTGKGVLSISVPYRSGASTGYLLKMNGRCVKTFQGYNTGVFTLSGNLPGAGVYIVKIRSGGEWFTGMTVFN